MERQFEGASHDTWADHRQTADAGREALFALLADPGSAFFPAEALIDRCNPLERGRQGAHRAAGR
jgi:hypothetical protein